MKIKSYEIFFPHFFPLIKFELIFSNLKLTSFEPNQTLPCQSLQNDLNSIFFGMDAEGGKMGWGGVT
jgi:hypothetical protein